MSQENLAEKAELHPVYSRHMERGQGGIGRGAVEGFAGAACAEVGAVRGNLSGRGWANGRVVEWTNGHG